MIGQSTPASDRRDSSIGLLVSVRSAEEARAALTGGASLIDVKEPARGSLGAAGPSVWSEVAAAVAGRVPLSAALGELLDENRPDPRLLGSAYQFAKLGLSGCARHSDWPARWSAAVALLPTETASVAVAYADWHVPDAPEPMEIVEVAPRAGCQALLIDTFDKSAGDLFAHLGAGELRRLIAEARKSGLLVVLAGSLSSVTVSQAAQLSPDLVAVRGAVCRGSRCAKVEEHLVRELASLLREKNRARPRQFA